MNIDHYINLIYKDLKGEITDHESGTLRSKMDSDDEVKKLYYDIKQTWLLTGESALVDNESVESDLASLIQKRDVSNKEKALWPNLLKIAAGFLLVVSSVFIMRGYLVNQSESLIAAESMDFTLPDGSEIWMKKGSSISYEKKFEKARNLELKGLAEFRVTPDVQNPFTISVNGAEVKVLGTTFTVDGLNDRVVVSVQEGRVQVSKGNEAVILIENEVAHIASTEALPIKTSMNAINFSQLKNGQFRFTGETMQEIADQLSLILNKELIIEDENMRTCSISAVFNGIRDVEILEKIAEKFNMQLVQEQDNIFTFKGGECI